MQLSDEFSRKRKGGTDRRPQRPLAPAAPGGGAFSENTKERIDWHLDWENKMGGLHFRGRGAR